MKKYNTNMHCRGVSIVEALIAAVVVGIGFVSVYTMTTVSTRMIHKATQRDNDTLSLSMIMDDLAVDRFAVADSSYYDPISSANYNNLNLASGCDAESNDAPIRKKDRQHRRWCNFLTKKEGGMGKADDNISLVLGSLAVFFGTLNVVGGWVVTDRMLEMFKKKKKK